MKDLKQNICFLTFFACLVFLIPNCGQIKNGKGNVETLLERATKNITTSESISDITRRNDLLKMAESQIRQAESLSQNQPSSQNDIASAYAYLYFAGGDYTQARKYAEKNNDKKDTFIAVLKARISLKEKGKDQARNVNSVLAPILAKKPRNSMAHLALGDSQFLMGNFQEAQKHFTEVLRIGEGFQVQAADRLEVLDQIRRTGINTGKVQNIILSLSLRRDEAANLLKQIYKADKYLKFGKSPNKKFKDVSGSLYAESIQALIKKGFFSYIEGENFEPYKIVTRGEIARMIEDFFVLKTGNSSLRTKYSKDSKSTIKGIDVKDKLYNPIRIAIDRKAMAISLDGSINPLEPVSGLEAMKIFSKLMK